MPKVLPFPIPKEPCRIALYARTSGSGFRLTLSRNTDPAPLITLYDLVLYDMVAILRSLEIDPRVLSEAIDSMLDGDSLHFIEVELTSSQLVSFVKKRT
jgi:hypothetical protein